MLDDLAALYVNSPELFTVSVFVLGLVVGSFLNVVIYRLPIMLEREWRSQAAELLPLESAAAPAERAATCNERTKRSMLRDQFFFVSRRFAAAM